MGMMAESEIGLKRVVKLRQKKDTSHFQDFQSLMIKMQKFDQKFNKHQTRKKISPKFMWQCSSIVKHNRHNFDKQL